MNTQNSDCDFTFFLSLFEFIGPKHMSIPGKLILLQYSQFFTSADYSFLLNNLSKTSFSDFPSLCSLGDILGSAMKNTQNLLKMPFGCGEQNMVLFAPNIYVLNYLNETQQLTPEVKSKAIGYLNTGE